MVNSTTRASASDASATSEARPTNNARTVLHIDPPAAGSTPTQAHVIGNSPYITRLEEKFVAEIAVTGAIFGMAAHAQAAWARREFPPAYAHAYVGAWLEGRERAQIRLRRYARELRGITRDDNEQWEQRLQRMRIVLRSGEYVLAVDRLHAQASGIVIPK